VVSIENDVSVGRQALRRVVNERIRNDVGPGEAGTIYVFCECGRRRCSDRLEIPADDFDETVRAGRYVMAAGHA
jgi:hypothetical protein